ncbi:hypothetical protein F4677DRAFT_232011 [Hypoxylon crocopeplum]|nr:hypothetical protein F4677DRAFT_232011 [Hypoxylon crocopeplum]
MAIHWLLSLVCLLASLAVAQDYSGGDLLDATITMSVTETVTKYLSQCGLTPTPFLPQDTTILGTTTVTSTLQSTVSITVQASVTNITDVSGVLPTGISTRGPSMSLSHTYTASGGLCSGFNCTTSLANVTTKLPCSTATAVVPAPFLTTSTSTLSPIHSVTPLHGTSSVAATNVSPSQISISESVTLRDNAAVQSILGALGTVFLLTTGFL